VKRLIKQGLLRYGGYAVARNIRVEIENYNLKKRLEKFHKTGLAPLPDMVMFEPTQRCNLRCKMCFQDRQALANREELTFEQITKFFDNNPYLQKITFIGGEIFMRQDMIDIIRHLDRSRDMVICTNATMLGKSEIDTLRHCHRIYTICISLEGPKAVHESIRRVKGSYNKTVQAISTLTRYFPITVNAVIQEENLNVLPELVDICAELKVKKLKLELERLFHKEGICQAVEETPLDFDDLPISSNGRERQYSTEDLERILAECQDRGKKAGIYVTFDPPFLTDDIEACYFGRFRTKKRFISQSFRTATIAPNGDLINCLTVRKPFGNILEAPFDEVWNSETAITFRKNLLDNNLTALCENCPFMKAL
jgi:radical SAM protein with 4Fe4S-binding SPASM domain